MLETLNTALRICFIRGLLAQLYIVQIPRRPFYKVWYDDVIVITRNVLWVIVRLRLYLPRLQCYLADPALVFEALTVTIQYTPEKLSTVAS